MAAILKMIISYAIIRTLASLGIGIVTYAAVIYALKNFIEYAKVYYNGIPADTLNFMALAGVPEALGIVCGAVIARASLTFVKRLAFL